MVLRSRGDIVQMIGKLEGDEAANHFLKEENEPDEFRDDMRDRGGGG